jgi:hypothetical protein
MMDLYLKLDVDDWMNIFGHHVQFSPIWFLVTGSCDSKRY